MFVTKLECLELFGFRASDEMFHHFVLWQKMRGIVGALFQRRTIVSMSTLNYMGRQSVRQHTMCVVVWTIREFIKLFGFPFNLNKGVNYKKLLRIK